MKSNVVLEEGGAFLCKYHTGGSDILLRTHTWPCRAPEVRHILSGNSLGNCPFLLGSQEALMASPSHIICPGFLAL